MINILEFTQKLEKEFKYVTDKGSHDFEQFCADHNIVDVISAGPQNFILVYEQLIENPKKEGDKERKGIQVTISDAGYV